MEEISCHNKVERRNEELLDKSLSELIGQCLSAAVAVIRRCAPLLYT